MIKISIIIVSWNAKKYVAECLDSLRPYAHDSEVEIIVVDNASSDGTPEFVRDSHPTVTLIRNAENLGFAKANNIGIRRSSGKYLYLINSDVNVYPGCIEKLMAYMEENPKVGLLGPRMLGPDGKSYRSYMGEPTLWRLFCRALGLDTLLPKSKFFSGFMMSYFLRDRTTEVDVLNGWFWVARRQALETVGLLDETLFIYGEDIDWSRRFRNAGWKVVFFSEAESLHYGGASSSRAPFRFSVEMQKANYQYWRKYHGRPSQILYVVIIWIHQALRFAGYSMLRTAKSRRSEAEFKAKRSLACLRWAMGSEEKQGEQT